MNIKTFFILPLITMSLYAGSTTSHINIGANSIAIDSRSGNGFDISCGASVIFKNRVFGTFDFSYGQSNINNEITNNYGIDLKLGYKYHNIALYFIGSGIEQSYISTNGVGFGFGSGVEYTPFKHIGFGLDYKTYSMTSSKQEYDFKVTKAYLKIIF